MPSSARFPVAVYSRAAVIMLALATVAVVGFLDFLTGYQISFAVFYLLPVSIAAWYATRHWGVVLAFGSSLIWYSVEIAGGYPYEHEAIPIWNAFVRFVSFLIIALLLSALRGRLMTETLLAKTDPLTGLANSRAFLEHLDHELALADRLGNPLTLAYVDLDDFKRINDTHGHGEGDRLLYAVAQQLLKGVRRSDVVARLGGDEFALILPATGLEGAQTVLRKLAETLQQPNADIPSVTCSIGAVVFQQPPASAAAALSAADRLMYDAKLRGKSNVVIKLDSELTPETCGRQRTADAT